MKLYNTLTEQKEELKKPFFRSLKLFVCGPTVYDTPHIGNARTFVFFDMLTRYLRSQGFKITYLQNITDIDDKIIQRSFDEKTEWQKISARYEKIFHENLIALGVDVKGMQFARATDHIPEIITQVQTLIKKGHVYKIDGDGWYFDLTTYSDYGQLAKRTIAQAEDGVTRVDNSDKKRNAGDFCVWKFSRSGEPTWPSADLGDGRPGWHIEDTAITEKVFGPQYDLHGGAIDLKFPHHEAERAQQESASGKKPFVKLWMHAGFLTINGQKMSKSLGNFLTIDDVLKKMSANEFRMMLLMTHYRKPLDFTEERIQLAKRIVESLQELLWKFNHHEGKESNKLIDKRLDDTKQNFISFINDDFDTYKAFGLVIGTLEVQIKNARGNFSSNQAKKIASFLIETFTSFGINLVPTQPIQPISYEKLPKDIQKLFEEYKLLRSSKQFTQSDSLRSQIEGLGYIVEDTKEGSRILPKS